MIHMAIQSMKGIYKMICPICKTCFEGFVCPTCGEFVGGN